MLSYNTITVCIATYRVYFSRRLVIVIRVRANMCTAIHHRLHMYVHTTCGLMKLETGVTSKPSCTLCGAN